MKGQLPMEVQPKQEDKTQQVFGFAGGTQPVEQQPEPQAPKEKSDLVLSSIGLIVLDHKAPKVEEAFSLLEPEVKDVDALLDGLKAKDHKNTEVIQAVWNNDKLSLYQRLYALYKFGYTKGSTLAKKGVAV